MGKVAKTTAGSRKRSRKLRDNDIDFIARLITGWPECAPKWDEIIAKVKSVTGEEYTRQALARHKRIVLALEARRERPDSKRAPRGSVAARIAQDKIEKLKTQVAALEKENADLKEQFVRWAYNAYGRGLTREMLDADLPAIRRGNRRT